MQKFSEIPYRSPDLEEFKTAFAELTGKLAAATSAAQAEDTILTLQELENRFATAHRVAYIRNTMNTEDPFYDGEMEYYNKTLPSLVPLRKEYLRVFLSTPYRKELEAKFGQMPFLRAEVRQRIQSEAIIEDMVEESSLCTRYKKLAASCKTDFLGKECNFYGLLKFMQSTDRPTRKAAFEAWSGLYEQAAPELDEIYDKLVAVRVRMAEKLEMDSYISLAYLNKGRLDYTREEVARFRQQVLKTIVPACEKIRVRQANRIGVDKLKYYDESFIFPDGNPDPRGTTSEMVDSARRMYHELSPETGEFIDFMTQYELFDLETRPGKHLGGYCSSIPEYKAPFIFSNFNGTSADVDVLTHEAGHAFQYYTASRRMTLSENVHSTSEINEIHSMAMEHFTYPWMDYFFGPDTAKYRYAHLCGALLTIPYLVCVDEFQHRVFDRPGMSADERRGVWREIEQTYMPWRDYDDMGYMEQGGFWMQKQHIFLYPFYYIDYALAQICVFELYGRMKSDPKSAWEDYLRLCQAGGSKGYFELLKVAGLSNPFEPGSVEKAVHNVLEEIEALGTSS